MPEQRALPIGPFTAQHAADSAISRQQLRQLVRDGRVRRVFRGVYQREDEPDSIDNRIRAASLVVPQHAVVCDRTAAWLQGIDLLRYRELEVPPPLDIVVRRAFTPSRRAGWRNGERDFAPQDLYRACGLTITTPVRTVLDLSCKLHRREALAALDLYAREYGLDAQDLLSELVRFRGRRGVIQARSLVPLMDGDAESARESWVRMAILDAGLPKPVLQFEIVVDGRVLYRLDHAYPKNLICIEYDGEADHGTPEQRAADEVRRNWLRAHGWTVIVLRKEDLTGDAVQRWTEQVRKLLLTPTRWPRG